MSVSGPLRTFDLDGMLACMRETTRRRQVNEDLQNCLRESRIRLVVWTGGVAGGLWLSAGFGDGGFAGLFRDNPPIWVFATSPLIPLVLWLKARRDLARNDNQ
jgi:hypothetical protein